MRIKLTKKEKISLLKAVQTGEFNTFHVPRLCDIIQGSNAFEDLMRIIDAEDDED